MELHNVNASDAAILSAFLRYAHSVPQPSPRYVLVASDQRLLTAAHAEGLATLDPESFDAGQVPAFLATL